MNLNEALETFVKGGNRRDATIKDYRCVIGLLIKHLGNCELEEVTPEMLDAWTYALRHQTTRYVNHPYRPEEKGGLSQATYRGYVCRTMTFFKWLTNRRHLDINPAQFLELPARPQRMRSKAATPEEVMGVLEAADTPRDIAIVLFLADTGCRAAGLCSLNFETLGFMEKSAILEEKGGKEVPAFWSDETNQALTLLTSTRDLQRTLSHFTTIE